MQAHSEMQYAEPYLAAEPLLEHYGSWMPIDSASPAPFMLLNSLLSQAKKVAKNRRKNRPHASCHAAA